MSPRIGATVYVVVMIAAVVVVDFAFFRERFTERAIANVGIVALFALFYWRFIERHRAG